MPRHRLFALLLVLSTFTSFAATAAAQTETAPTSPVASLVTIRGVVLDPTRAPISGARITMEASSLAARSTMTDERGEFSFSVPDGRYDVTVAANGFVTVNETLDVGRETTAQLVFVLPIAGLNESVSVSAPTPSPYQISAITTSTKTPTPLLDVPQSITIVTKELMQDQLMSSLADVVRYVPGISSHQGENNRDQVIIRGNNSSADFFIDGVRDDVQYFRDLYNLERVEALKGPNAMIFGRGGGGGVINRVSKEPSFAPNREVTVVGGMFGAKRITADVDQPINSRLALRVNGLYDNSDSFRQNVNAERYAVNPTFAIQAGARTQITIGYEHLRDNRVADRGITSFQGRPADVDVSTYYGNPADSYVHARADVTTASVTHQAGAVSIHNRTLIGNYERGYQNFVPGVVNADRTQVALSSYNNNTERLNVFNQTDLTSVRTTGTLRHTLLAGAELGRQSTDNFRNTGFFNNTATSILVPFASPTISTPVTFRQSATDANNHVRTTVLAAYGQDQIELSRFLQLLAGVRFDSFNLDYHDNRTGNDLSRIDRLVSPRAGLVIKPIAPVSIYGSFTVSYLPGSGDQFSSLTTITEQLKPEKFTNYEVGAKWDLRPTISLTTAVYRLDRTNTRATDPNDPTRIVQTGGQRTNGYELGVNGRLTPYWQIAGGYAYQDAFVVSATTAAAAGAHVAQVPRHTFSLWNMFQVRPKVGVGLGVVQRTDTYAAIDNTVTLPGYADFDAAVYLSLTARTRLQVNVENLFDRKYYVNADSNTNISPGSPRTVRVALIARF
jgi:catecholate siderophore receptor